MTFPTIPTSGASRILSSANTAGGATKTFPDLSSLTKNAGDLLIAICIEYTGGATNTEFSSWGGGFTEFVDQATTGTMAIGAAYKFSTGSETGTFTVATATTASTSDSVMILLSIEGAHASTPPEGGAIANGTGAAADPASFDPGGWGAEDTLWIAVCGAGEDNTTGSFTAPSAAPTSYGSLFVTAVTADVAGGVYGAVAFRQVNASAENVGPFTVDTSNARNSALLIAVRPVPAVAYTRDVDDTVNIGDSPTAATVTGLLLKIVGITDDVDVELGAAPIAREVNDTVGLTDARALDLTASVVDAVGLTDTRALNLTASAADAVGLTDAVSVAVGRVQTVSDTFGLTDTRALDLTASVTDTLGLTDVVTPETAGAITRTVNDNLGLTDTAAQAGAYLRTADDTVNIGDSPVATNRSGVLPSFVGLTDDVTADLGGPIERTVDDTVGLSDTATGVKFLGRTVSDTVGVSDASSSVSVVETVTDAVGLTDSVSVQTTGAATRTVDDTVGLADTRALGLTASQSDTVGLSDTRAVAQTVTLADTVGITDSVAVDLAGAATRTVSDTLGLTDAAVVTATYERASSDMVDLTDARALDRAASVADPVGVTDSVSVQLAGANTRQADDPVGITDTATQAGVYARTVSDTLGLTDDRTVDVTRLRAVSDTIGVTDTVGVVKLREVSDTIGVTDAVTQVSTYVRTIGDTVELTDTVPIESTALFSVGQGETSIILLASGVPVVATTAAGESGSQLVATGVTGISGG